MSAQRILIVDDARDVGRMYQQALRTVYPKMPVTYVPSAEEAIVEVTTYKVDLMVVDIRLPGMSGFELVKRVLARQPGVKVIMITGMDIDSALEAQSRAAGASKILAKPLGVSDFLSAIEEALAGGGPGAAEDSAADKAAHERTRIKTAPIKAPVPEPPPMVEVAGPAGPTLSEELSNVRASLGATAALLLDDTGRITAQAGDGNAQALVEQLAADLMAGLSTTHKLSRALGAPAPVAVQALRGSEHNLIVAPVGRFALVVVLPGGSSGLRMALAFEEALNAQTELARILGEMGLNISPIASDLPAAEAPAAPRGDVEAEEEEESEAPVEDLQALEALLGGSGREPAAQEADDFWDNLASGESAPPSNPDVLSYDQARKLGLFPEEEN